MGNDIDIGLEDTHTIIIAFRDITSAQLSRRRAFSSRKCALPAAVLIQCKASSNHSPS